MHHKNIQHHKNVKVKKVYHISRLVQCFAPSGKHDHLIPQRSRVHSLLIDRDSLSWKKKCGKGFIYFTLQCNYIIKIRTTSRHKIP